MRLGGALVVENALSAGAGFSVTGDVGVTGNVWANGAFVSWLNSTQEGGAIGVYAPLSFNGSVGSAGQVLTSNGAGQLPTWQSITWNGGTVTSSITAPFLKVTANNGALQMGDSTTTYLSTSYNDDDSKITAHYRNLKIDVDSGKHIGINSEVRFGGDIWNYNAGGNGSESGWVGTSGHRWRGAYIRTVHTVGGGAYDEYDDLAIIKLWGVENPKLPDDYVGTKKPAENDPFSMLRSSEDDSYFNLGELVSFNMCVSRRLAEKHDEVSDVLLALYDGVEVHDAKLTEAEAKITALEARIAALEAALTGKAA